MKANKGDRIVVMHWTGLVVKSRSESRTVSGIEDGNSIDIINLDTRIMASLDLDGQSNRWVQVKHVWQSEADIEEALTSTGSGTVLDSYTV